MKLYCMGFCVTNGDVLLVRKDETRPSGAGWNGIGGLVEQGETTTQAMEREWLEETGRAPVDWRHVGALTNAAAGWSVLLYLAEPAERPEAIQPKREGAEEVAWMVVEDFLVRGEGCPWMKPALLLALERYQGGGVPPAIVVPA